VLALLVCSSYSYSSLAQEAVYGTTANAARDNAYNWVMTNVLPQQLGLSVNSVIYRYTTDKITEDDMLVHVQNENARGTGYIFRETDDWSGLPGNTINKIVPVNMIDISYWGRGSIEIEGNGTVSDAGVYYSYQYIPCEDPQSDATCPGYVDPTGASLVEQAIAVDTSSEEYIQNELDRKANLKAQKEEEDREERQRVAKEKEEDIKESLETLLGLDLGASLQREQDTLLHNALVATNYLPRSYFMAIKGGEYPDAEPLKDSKLPDSKRGLSVGLASELKHKQLVDLQYGNQPKEDQK
jgi:hypothetical protein